MVKNKITNITNLPTITALTAAENKIPNVSNLVKKADYNKKLLLIMVMVNILLHENLIG